MKKEFLLALNVYAYNEGYTKLPVTEVIGKFKADAEKCVKTYIGEGVKTLRTPLEFFTDFTLCYAKARVESGLSTYGELDKYIKNYVYRSGF
jgi:hypothetical protein